MTLRRVPSRWFVLPLLVMLIVPQGLFAQQDKTAAPKQSPAKPSASNAALDTLTGPIALYPDALVAQILEASKDVAAVQKFAGWLKANSALKGTALQDAAQKAGFTAPYIALAPFPQVVQMMVEKPDWTKQLGAAMVQRGSRPQSHVVMVPPPELPVRPMWRGSTSLRVSR